MYDATGLLYGFRYNNVDYYYDRDVLGNINNILSKDGLVVATYKYDAYGVHQVYDGSGTLVTNTNFIGNINPFRYKGYYYDIETGLYYLKTRYYNPLWGRFISPDNVKYLNAKSINGLNLYAYCDNDPVNKFDPSGCFPTIAIVALVAASIVINTAMIVAVAAIETAIVVGAVGAVAEIVKDVVNLCDKNSGIKITLSDDNVKVENSYKISSPIVLYAFAFYLNHIRKDTKDVIKGTTTGIVFEWILHNVANIFDGENGPAKDVDLGKTIFSDGDFHPLFNKEGKLTWYGIFSFGMRAAYILVADPISVIHDLIINGGF